MSWMHLLSLVLVSGSMLIFTRVSLRLLQSLERYRERRLIRRIKRRFAEPNRKPVATNVGDRGERRRRRLPSLSNGLVGLAIRRLPGSMDPENKKRWADEMLADVGSVPGRLVRLRVAFNIWRKGAPEIPAGQGEAPRRASE